MTNEVPKQNDFAIETNRADLVKKTNQSLETICSRNKKCTDNVQWQRLFQVWNVTFQFYFVFSFSQTHVVSLWPFRIHLRCQTCSRLHWNGHSFRRSFQNRNVTNIFTSIPHDLVIVVWTSIQIINGGKMSSQSSLENLVSRHYECLWNTHYFYCVWNGLLAFVIFRHWDICFKDDNNNTTLLVE